MGKITNKVVKIKKIQKTGKNLTLLLPKGWLIEMGWNRTTKLVLELLPHRKMIIVSELNLKDSVQTVPNMKMELKTPGILANEEVSDIIKVTD